MWRRGLFLVDVEVVRVDHCADSVLRRLVFVTMGLFSFFRVFCSEFASLVSRSRVLRSVMFSVIERVICEGWLVSW